MHNRRASCDERDRRRWIDNDPDGLEARRSAAGRSARNGRLQSSVKPKVAYTTHASAGLVIEEANGFRRNQSKTQDLDQEREVEHGGRDKDLMRGGNIS
jgi:hypothetical protein